MKPKKSDGEVAINANIPADLKEMLVAVAKKNHRTLRAEIIRALRKHIEAEGVAGWPPTPGGAKAPEDVQ